METGVVELKHHLINGRLDRAKTLLATLRLSLEECTDDELNTPYHWCVQGLEVEKDKREVPDEEVLVFILQLGAPKNQRNLLGETPLLTAVRLAMLEPKRAEALIKRMLVAGMADPCRPDIMGETPLMEAAASGLRGVVQTLLEHYANPLAQSINKLTAIQLAEETGEEAIVQLLKSPLAERAARENRLRNDEGTHEQTSVKIREGKVGRSEQTLFGQKQHPGLAWDQDMPGKPYPEYGTLHDID